MISPIVENIFISLHKLDLEQTLSLCQKRVNTIAVIFFSTVSEIKGAVLKSWSESIREQAKRIKDELDSSWYLSKLDFLNEIN